jgi:DNA-binding IclR family transcriptional regulator
MQMRPSPAAVAARGSNRSETNLQSGSLERGLRILEILASRITPISLTQLAAESSCDTSTTHRLLGVLARLEYVIKDPSSKCYLPAPRALAPLSLYHPLNRFRRDAHGTIQQVREDTGLTAALVLFIRGTRMVVDIEHGTERLSPFYETHLKRPVHSSATGKVLLASLPGERWIEVLGPEPYPAFTENTRTTAGQLATDLEKFSELGFASTRDESLNGLAGVAAPIRGRGDRIIGCVGAFGKSSGLLAVERHPEVAQKIKLAADLITHTSSSINELADFTGTP